MVPRRAKSCPSGDLLTHYAYSKRHINQQQDWQKVPRALKILCLYGGAPAALTKPANVLAFDVVRRPCSDSDMLRRRLIIIVVSQAAR